MLPQHARASVRVTRGKDPHLIQVGLPRTLVHLRVMDAGPGRQDLHISWTKAYRRLDPLPLSYLSCHDDRDDLDLIMEVERKATRGMDKVIVEEPEAAPADIPGLEVVAVREQQKVLGTLATRRGVASAMRCGESSSPRCGTGPRTESRRYRSCPEIPARLLDRTASQDVPRSPPGPLLPRESCDTGAETSWRRMCRREPGFENRREYVLPTGHPDSLLRPIAHGDCG